MNLSRKIIVAGLSGERCRLYQSASPAAAAPAPAAGS